MNYEFIAICDQHVTNSPSYNRLFTSGLLSPLIFRFNPTLLFIIRLFRICWLDFDPLKWYPVANILCIGGLVYLNQWYLDCFIPMYKYSYPKKTPFFLMSYRRKGWRYRLLPSTRHCSVSCRSMRDQVQIKRLPNRMLHTWPCHRGSTYTWMNHRPSRAQMILLNVS